MNRDLTQVLKMNRRGKRVFLRRLERLERIYGEESKYPVKGQRKITSFFVRVEEEVESIQVGGETVENRDRDTGRKVRVSRMKSGKGHDNEDVESGE